MVLLTGDGERERETSGKRLGIRLGCLFNKSISINMNKKWLVFGSIIFIGVENCSVFVKEHTSHVMNLATYSLRPILHPIITKYNGTIKEIIELIR